MQQCSDLMSFNSTLVQLKVANRRKGSASSFSFNSTLVQLKAFVVNILTFNKHCFNSTLVQLKDKYPTDNEPTALCFNSTLVQLKAVKNANKYTSKSMIYHPFILIFYKHLQSTFNS